MSSYRKRTQPKPTTAAGLRAQASASGNSIFRNRPRSISSLFSSVPSSYSSFLANSTGSSYSVPSFLSKAIKPKSSYSSSAGNLTYQSPYTTYGGTASGYGGLTLPSHSNSNINLPGPSSYTPSYSRSTAAATVSAALNRASSFNRPKPNSTVDQKNDFCSRSSSLQSLAGSEGYSVRVLRGI